MDQYDVVIIGAGVVGSACARELSKYNLKCCVLERCEDVCEGTTKANSGLIHAGFDALPNTYKAKLNVKGNEMMQDLADMLDIPFKRNGAIVVCHEKEDFYKLEALYDRGIENNVKGLEIIKDKQRIYALEPNLKEDVYAILYAKNAGIVCPFTFNLALAENAYENGVEFYFNTEVVGFKKQKDVWCIHTSQKDIKTRYVVNAAGVYSGNIHNMVSENKVMIIPRKGEYLLLDKMTANHINHTVFSLPTKLGKGVLTTPTVHGNILVGPNAEDLEDYEDTSTTLNGIMGIKENGCLNFPKLPINQVITSFAGLRAHEKSEDFIIGEIEDALGFFDCMAIASPGLSSAYPIGEMIKDLILEKQTYIRKKEFIEKRKGIVVFNELNSDQQKALISENPEYGNIVCRCEMVSNAEIIDAIKRPLGAKSIDAIKRRVRAGMGRCQAGFCLTKVMETLEKNTDLKFNELTKFSKESYLVTGRTKEQEV